MVPRQRQLACIQEALFQRAFHKRGVCRSGNAVSPLKRAPQSYAGLLLEKYGTEQCRGAEGIAGRHEKTSHKQRARQSCRSFRTSGQTPSSVMILRPLEPAPAGTEEFLPAWPVVERLQKQKYESCCLVTQPSHAALSGELASRFCGQQLPAPDQQLIRAIALHDAGWGMTDAQAIQQSRAQEAIQPESFIVMSVPRFLAAWQKSIETAQSVSPAGGYIVSSISIAWQNIASNQSMTHSKTAENSSHLSAAKVSGRKNSRQIAPPITLNSGQTFCSSATCSRSISAATPVRTCSFRSILASRCAVKTRAILSS